MAIYIIKLINNFYNKKNDIDITFIEDIINNNKNDDNTNKFEGFEGSIISFK